MKTMALSLCTLATLSFTTHALASDYNCSTEDGDTLQINTSYDSEEVSATFLQKNLKTLLQGSITTPAIPGVAMSSFEAQLLSTLGEKAVLKVKSTFSGFGHCTRLGCDSKETVTAELVMNAQVLKFDCQYAPIYAN